MPLPKQLWSDEGPGAEEKQYDSTKPVRILLDASIAVLGNVAVSLEWQRTRTNEIVRIKIGFRSSITETPHDDGDQKGDGR